VRPGSWLQLLRDQNRRGIVSSIGLGALAKARTWYYRTRYRKFVVWGAEVQVLGRLQLRGPGRIVIGNGCVFGGGSGDNVIYATEPKVTVHVSDGCVLNGLNIVATEDVTIGARVQVLGRLGLRGPGRIVIGDGCRFDADNAIHAMKPMVAVRIGDECYVNGVDIVATEDVTIGGRCMIGECSLVTTDYHSARPDRWSPDAPVNTGPITVGSNVWIAGRAVVTKGVSIGHNSVVSIGTIVREDVPENVIVSSHEQHVVKELDTFGLMAPTTWPTWWQREHD
jgi:acetyltransferase-like isoleucine patch superfamily enzyme